MNSPKKVAGEARLRFCLRCASADKSLRRVKILPSIHLVLFKIKNPGQARDFLF